MRATARPSTDLNAAFRELVVATLRHSHLSHISRSSLPSRTSCARGRRKPIALIEFWILDPNIRRFNPSSLSHLSAGC